MGLDLGHGRQRPVYGFPGGVGLNQLIRHGPSENRSHPLSHSPGRLGTCRPYRCKHHQHVGAADGVDGHFADLWESMSFDRGTRFNYEIGLNRQCYHIRYHSSTENPRDCSRTTSVASTVLRGRNITLSAALNPLLDGEMGLSLVLIPAGPRDLTYSRIFTLWFRLVQYGEAPPESQAKAWKVRLLWRHSPVLS